jgi:hypothetical protein
LVVNIGRESVRLIGSWHEKRGCDIDFYQRSKPEENLCQNGTEKPEWQIGYMKKINLLRSLNKNVA